MTDLPEVYKCPRCGSKNVWWDYTIDAYQAANPDKHGDHHIEECDTGGDRHSHMMCHECNHTTDNGEEWQTIAWHRAPRATP